jgi:hypothetical protein
VNLKINEPEGGLRAQTNGAPVAAAAPAPAPQSEAARSLDEAMADLKLD